MMDGCPFKTGDHVRVKPGRAGNLKFTRGTVTSVWEGRRLSAPWAAVWDVYVRRPGSSKSTTYSFRVFADDPDYTQWEHVPACDISLDETAAGLARAVLAGDVEAARILADRVFELVGGPR